LSQTSSDQSPQGDGQAYFSRRFASISIGLFFLVSTISIVVFMFFLITRWQPIWSTGFDDFHTISDAIGALDETAQPTSEAVPLMLAEMVQMNRNMAEMQAIMRQMNQSMTEIEKVSPGIQHMTGSIDNMNSLLHSQMSNMVYIMDRVEDKMPNMGFGPFN